MTDNNKQPQCKKCAFVVTQIVRKNTHNVIIRKCSVCGKVESVKVSKK